MQKEHYYEVNVEWTEGRKGKLSSPVLNDTVECATPPEFPQGVEGIWSPEHLYAASINSCYMATFLAVAENFKLDFLAFKSKTVCKLEMSEGKFKITEATIIPELQLNNPEVDKEKAVKVLEKSKNACYTTTKRCVTKVAVQINLSTDLSIVII